MDGLVERKKKEIRDRIIAVAGGLFNRQGFESTTMDQIAAEAVVARKTLYNYFPLKEAIADEYVRSISKETARETSEILSDLPDTRSQLISAINNRYDWLELNPELCGIVLRYRMKVLLQEPNHKFESSGTQTLIMNILRADQERGKISSDIPIERVFGIIEYMRTAMVLDWLKDNTRVNLREETVRLVDLVLYGALGKQDNTRNYLSLKKE
ncbi:TetR/AcrR family transcriptional regulator [Desulfosporosinus nitroreducens]|uniref:TetR/AcrR family transcriptional regulator n=1 Tax=Desulfosporosinus nitroreducens TaxID=2018668 RepID=UPI00207D0AD3|nr:TetR/AcrR family transcriptional regulator [Desulfosporosinus nitroreducens]MCO1601979.1 TetR/AcrR family transcriptional regulator [Desulfosporosinus nitroreducens]